MCDVAVSLSLWSFNILADRNTSGFVPTFTSATAADLSTLRDGMSIREIYAFDGHAEGNEFEDFVMEIHPLCSTGKSGLYMEQTLNSIEKALKFYENHLYMLHTIDSIFGLRILKGVDDKHGQRFQKVFPLAKWISEICNQFEGDTREKCRNIPKIWKARDSNAPYKSKDIVSKYDSKWDMKSVGNEKEHIWAILNSECQSALINRCEVPYVCEQTLFDPEPRSQYFLTRQLLQRVFVEQHSEDCPSLKRFIDQDINDQLCAKMYKEANLVASLKYPHLLRDIFSEYVAFCGHAGYPNFFREDWLQNILSWQSRSEYGCFLHEKDYKSRFISSDEPIMRVTTPAETQLGMTASDEMCLPHFTAVGLSALAVNWDYMEENCH